MTISEEIKKRAGRMGYKSSDWYTNALMNELAQYQKKDINQLDTNFIIPGDFVFFLYSAKYPQKYKFWDQHPLVYVLEVRPREGLFLGSNVHYINPSYRGAVAKSYLNKKGVVNAPRKTLKNYLFGNVVTDFYKIPKDELEEISLLPVEKFVDKRGNSFPKYKVWDYPDSLSSP
jgi:hypothetical protein